LQIEKNPTFSLLLPKGTFRQGKKGAVFLLSQKKASPRGLYPCLARKRKKRTGGESHREEKKKGSPPLLPHDHRARKKKRKKKKKTGINSGESMQLV